NGNAITVADVDAEGGALTTTLGVTNGTLSVTAAGHGATVTGSGSGSVTISGTLAEINAALEGLTYQGGLHFGGSVTLTIVTSDLGNTGAPGPLTDSDTRTIQVLHVADQPSLLVTAPVTTVEDTAVPLTIASALVDGDGSETLTVTISGIPAGTSFSNGAGDVLVPVGGSLSLTAAQLGG